MFARNPSAVISDEGKGRIVALKWLRGLTRC
jgi:hypothetical protein